MRDHADICAELFPSNDRAGYLAAMRSPRYAQLIEEFEITTIDRAAMLLATWAHETGGFVIMRENGNYSTAARIVEMFGPGRHSAAITEAEARRLVRKPFDLFERVYGLGNPRKAAELGNVREGDGFLFRGCSIQQLTGRRDHERYAAAIGCRVEALAEPINGIHAALLEWREKGCNAIADRGDLRGVRRAINGGMNGWEDFSAKYALIKRALTETSEIGDVAIGSRGDAVRELQSDLQARGFYKSAEVDGSFGALTKRSVVAFQASQDLPPTGVYDEATRQALMSAPVEATLPGRKARDTMATVVDGARKIWAAILAALGLNEGANQLGFEPIEKLLAMIDRAKGLIGKLQVQPRFVVYAVIALAIFAIVKLTKVRNAD